MRNQHARRGQVLPIWILGILGTFALIFTALDYGNSLRWHIRAQSAADSAAQATLALQSQRWNEMMELLYGMNIEEYRIRHLLDGILLASTASGGCVETSLTPQANGGTDPVHDCEAVYDILTPQYLKAVQRYSQEAALLHKVAANATFANWNNDANALISELQTNCNVSGVATTVSYNKGGGDCAFQYHFIATQSNLTPPTDTRNLNTTGYGLSTVTADGTLINIPSYGNASAAINGVDTENASLFAPVQVDVVTCAYVPPIIPSFFKMTTQPYHAIGRAAATNVMFVQDWFEPGGLYNPNRTALNGDQVFFQPAEKYDPVAPPNGQTDDFYAVDFQGNAAVAHTATGLFGVAVTHNEMSVRLGWWNSIPVRATNVQHGAPDTNADCPNSIGSTNG